MEYPKKVCLLLSCLLWLIPVFYAITTENGFPDSLQRHTGNVKKFFGAGLKSRKNLQQILDLNQSKDQRRPHQRPSFNPTPTSNKQDHHDDEISTEFTPGYPYSDIRSTSFGMESIPSLMLDMMKKNEVELAKLPGRCHFPGHGGNIVRNLKNKGDVIYTSQHTTITELQFNFNDAFQNNEKALSAIIYVTTQLSSSHQKHKWTAWRSKFQFSIHWMKRQSWIRMMKILEGSEDDSHFSYNHQINQVEEANMMARLEEHIGSPVASRNISFISQHVDKQTTEPLVVTKMIPYWRKESLRHRIRRDAISRAVLIIQEEEEEMFTQSTEDFGHQKSFGRCQDPFPPQLILVSIDRTQCPDQKEAQNDVEQSEDSQKPTQQVPIVNNRLFSENINTQQLAGTKSNATQHNRSIRAVRSNVCQRLSMWVDFEDLGWDDWIIAPRAFQAYRCAGECPFPLGSSLNGTNHAMLMTMMNSVDPMDSPRPCCVPTKLSSVTLLYLDNADNVVLRQYEDMVIESCGCR
ncbi:uncharacterized protein LOC143445725 [Clavelina lepadiformis]|uniref:TGF-beta family profile domain-containing protein n=1 Tax=Clavelina lepadiformis TaxID=159417 RepID=A0ABP0FIU6_CLALP